jgi:hypothetical protein
MSVAPACGVILPLLGAARRFAQDFEQPGTPTVRALYRVSATTGRGARRVPTRPSSPAPLE